MVARMKTAYVLCFCLLLAVNAQAQGTTVENAPRLLLCVESRPGSPYTEAEIKIAAKSVAFALKAAADRVMIVEYGIRNFPETTEGRMEACREMRTDGWLWIGLSGEKAAPVLQLSAFNAVSGVSIVEKSFQRDRSLSLQVMVEEKWQEIVPAVAAAFGSLDSSLSSRVESMTAELTLRALPGTLITGLPGVPLAVGTDGSAVASLTTPGVYSARAELFGYSPASLNVYLVSAREISFIQEPGSRWAFDLSFFNSMFPGGNAAFFIVQNWIFAKFEAMTYLFGLALDSENIIFSIPLFNFGLGFGTYLAPEDFALRPYIVAGGFLRISWLPGFAPGVEPLSPGGISLDIGVEFPVFKKGSLFIEYVPMLYLTGNLELFMASLGSVENQVGYYPIPFGTTSFGVLNYLNLRFGFRWLL
jgi:hypothetical protein